MAEVAGLAPTALSGGCFQGRLAPILPTLPCIL